MVHVSDKDSSKYGTFMYLGLLLSAALAAIVGGRISDRRGRKPLIYLAGGLMSVVSVLFITYILLNTVSLPGPFALAPSTPSSTLFCSR